MTPEILTTIQTVQKKQDMTMQDLVEYLGAVRDALVESSLLLQDELFQIEQKSTQIFEKEAQEALQKAQR